MEHSGQISPNPDYHSLTLEGAFSPPAQRLLAQLIALLPPTTSWRVIETHLSLVLISPTRVLKLKKPVRLPFVDHEQLHARWQSTLSEFTLNRRLTTDLYLGITLLPDTPPFDPAGLQPTDLLTPTPTTAPNSPPPPPNREPILLMQTLPEGATLDTQLNKSADELAPQIAEVAERLAAFHQAQQRTPHTTDPTLQRFTKLAADNITALKTRSLAHDHTPALTYIEARQQQLLAALGPQLTARAAAGCIIDGHGDLRAEHIAWAFGSLQIFDCIEFSSEIRTVDVLDDLAFLAMDLERRGRADLAAILIKHYRAYSPKSWHSELFNLYKSYRALVRAKVEAIQAEQQEETSTLLARYLGLAGRYLSGLTRPFVIVMSGLMGSGKSTLAARLEALTAAALFQTDALRHELYGRTQGDRSLDFGTGKYSAAHTEETYRRLFGAAEESLRRGEPVILDGSFSAQRYRDDAKALTARFGAVYLPVRCVLNEAKTLLRLQERARRQDSLSDGRVELYHRQAAQFESFTEEESRAGCLVHTETPLEEQAAQILEKLSSQQSDADA